MPASGAERAGLKELPVLADHLLGELHMRDVPATTGEFAMEMPVGPRVANNRGGLQGGLIATLVDVLAGRAALEGMPLGLSVATADLSLHYLSAVRIGPARAEATVLRRGRTKIVVRVDVYDAGRDVLAVTGTTTFVVIPLREDQDDMRPLSSAEATSG